MKLTCLLRRHAASNPYFATRNGDIWFGECPICLTEIIKVGHARWREVPRGYRIVWRSRPMSEMAASPPARGLPRAMAFRRRDRARRHRDDAGI